MRRSGSNPGVGGVEQRRPAEGDDGGPEEDGRFAPASGGGDGDQPREEGGPEDEADGLRIDHAGRCAAGYVSLPLSLVAWAGTTRPVHSPSSDVLRWTPSSVVADPVARPESAADASVAA